MFLCLGIPIGRNSYRREFRVWTNFKMSEIPLVTWTRGDSSETMKGSVFLVKKAKIPRHRHDFHHCDPSSFWTIMFVYYQLRVHLWPQSLQTPYTWDDTHTHTMHARARARKLMLAHICICTHTQRLTRTFPTTLACEKICLRIFRNTHTHTHSWQA